MPVVPFTPQDPRLDQMRALGLKQSHMLMASSMLAAQHIYNEEPKEKKQDATRLGK